MNSPEFYSSAHEKKFLEEQLKEYIKVKDGDSTWKEFNDWRVSKGYDSVNTDSLRRSFQQLGVYTDAGLVGSSTPLTPSTSSTQHTAETTTNYDTGETTSKKTIKLSNTQLTDSNSLLRAHGFDPAKFEIKTVTNTEINRSTDRLDTGATIETHTINSRLVVKPRTTPDFTQSVDYFNSITPREPFTSVNSDNEEILIIPIYDVHFGRLPYSADAYTYSLEEEKNKIVSHFEKYITKLRDRTFKAVYLVVGQDYFNSSYNGFTSSQSHLQDNAMSTNAMFNYGCETLIELIDDFSIHCDNLKVVGNIGNHATAEEYHMFKLLEAYYRMCPNIEIDSTPDYRKYLKYGESLIGFAHGDKEHKRLFGLMQVEAKDQWSDTSTHIWLTGHLHHFKVESDHGVEVYRVPAICCKDAWTEKNGFTANEPKSMAFIFDEEGLSETITIKL